MSANLTSEAVKIAQRILAACEEERKVAKAIVRRNPEGPRTASQRERDFMRAMAGIIPQVDKWNSDSRQVLAIHPSLAESIRLAGSSEIEPRVFETLPYTNPMVVFPELPLVSDFTDATHRARLLGFFCSEELCSCGKHTTVEGTTGKELVLVAVVENSGTNTIGLNTEYTRIPIPITGKPSTLDEIIEAILPEFAASSAGGDTDAAAEFVRDITKIAVGSILYLCSTVVDDERIPYKTVKGSVNGVPIPPPELHRVGWRIGRAVSQRSSEDRDREESSAASTGTGHAQAPQHRRAHFKTVWTGPGRKIPKSVFVLPYWTKRDEMGLHGGNTVRIVS